MDNYTPNPDAPACPHCTDDVECADHAAKQVERCSCEESQALRLALVTILTICDEGVANRRPKFDFCRLLAIQCLARSALS